MERKFTPSASSSSVSASEKIWKPPLSVSVQGLELGVGDALDGGLRAHGHEDRRLDVTMWRMQAAQARSASGVGRYEIEFEHV